MWSRMRIVFFSGPDVADPDGSFPQTHRVAGEMRRRGWRPLHAAPRLRGNPRVKRGEVPIVEIGWGGFSATGGSETKLLRRVAHRAQRGFTLGRWLVEMRRRPPALLCATLAEPAVWFTSQAADRMGIPWVLTAIGSGLNDEPTGAEPLLRELAAAATRLRAVVAPSAEALRCLEPWIPSTVEQVIIPPGTDATPSPLPQEPLVVALGRMDRAHGFDVLLRALPAICRGESRVQVILAGQGPESRALRKLADGLDPSARAAIRWEGLPGEARSRELCRRARVVVFPGRSTGSEPSITRALALGRPVVATRAAGFPLHDVDAGNGLLVPPDDASSLAEAVLSVLRDDTTAEQLAQASAGAAMRELAWAETADQYHALFLRHAIRQGQTAAASVGDA